MGNGAVMEGIESNLFFTFFGLEGIMKTRMDKLHTGVVGNPAMRLPGGMRMPNLAWYYSWNGSHGFIDDEKTNG